MRRGAKRLIIEGVKVMHDCRTTESRLVDLLFNELEADEKSRLLAELEDCAICLDEYRSMTGTLVVFEQAAAAALPDESFWPRHHASVRQRLKGLAPRAPHQSDSFWKRLLMARLPVPVPAVAAVIIALLISIALSLRSSKAEVTPVLQPSVVTTAPSKVIEVPVFREKVVTRTVYVERKRRPTAGERRQTPQLQRNDTALTARYGEEASGQGGFFTRGDLTNFQPPDEMRIRIIKRSNLK
jgi:hypothetical protein